MEQVYVFPAITVCASNLYCVYYVYASISNLFMAALNWFSYEQTLIEICGSLE